MNNHQYTNNLNYFFSKKKSQKREKGKHTQKAVNNQLKDKLNVTINQSFESSGSPITDNEYEVSSENDKETNK